MYEAFYGFKEKPFSMLPDPGFLYLSKKHQAALTLLEYGLINHVGFCVISGEAGAGKTTILRALLERIGDDVTVGMITNTHQSFGGLLDWVLSAFDLHKPNLTHVEMHQVFIDYLIEQYANNHTVLLIVDEAQNMKADALEELRMLSNVNSDKDQLMQVVLAGQPALKDTLRRPDLKQFAQRIAVDYHLDSLGLKETCGYIQHRLVIAGATKDVFTPAACERIHCYSGGTPRLINLLCETVLVYGFADQQDLIDVDLVDEMVQERMKDSVVPIVNRDIIHEEKPEINEELERDFPWIQPEGGTEGLKPEGASQAEETSSVDGQEIIEEFIAPDDATENADQSANVDATSSEQAVEGVLVEEDEQATIDKSLSDTDVPINTAPDNTSSETATQAATSDNAASETQANVTAKSDSGAGAVHRVKNADNRAGDNRRSTDIVHVPSANTGSQAKRFGLMAGALAVVLVVLAVLLDDDAGLEEIKTEALQMQKQRDVEENQLKQLQLEAQALKKERDEAIAQAKEDRHAKQQAERLAEEKAEALAKRAEANRRQETKRLEAATMKRERKAMQAEAEAKAEAKYAKIEAARLAAESSAIQKRLDEEIRLKQLQEARSMELERLNIEQQRLQTEASREFVSEEPVKETKRKSEDCTGPTARFKSGCR